MKHPLITSDILYYKIRNHMIVKLELELNLDLLNKYSFISKC